jgi:hypothetical protein
MSYRETKSPRDEAIVARSEEGLSHDLALAIVNGAACGIATVAAARLIDTVASRTKTKPKAAPRKSTK